MSIYWNNQKWNECQLVTLWNAAKFYGIKVPKRYGKEYKKACDRACAISGGALHPEYVSRKLGLKAIQGKLKWAWVKENLPVEFHIFCHRGYHSVLAVGLRRKIIVKLWGKRDARKNYREPKRIYNEIALTNFTRNKITWVPWAFLKNMQFRYTKPVKWVEGSKL